MGVRVEFDAKKLHKKIEGLGKKGTGLLTHEVIKDSNVFIPMDSGELMRSALKSSDYANGKAIWDTSYARRLYYNPQFNFNTAGKTTKHKDGKTKFHRGNPNARGLWFEEAKAVNLPKWVNLVEEAIRRGL